MKLRAISTDRFGIQFAVLNRLFQWPFVRKIWSKIIRDNGPIDESLRPVFVIGCGHSGTSLLAAILAAHPSFGALTGETYAFRPWHRKEQIAAFLGRKITNEVPNKLRPLEKTPRHVHEVRRIRSLYSGAQFVAIIKDGRDVVASIKRRTGRSRPAMARFSHDNKALLDLRDEDWVHILRYEDLVTCPEDTLRGVLRFLGEPYQPLHEEFHERKYDWYKSGSDHSQRRNAQVNSPLFNGSGGWRKGLTPKELRHFVRRCGEVQALMGYEVHLATE
ncbi:MAG: sulfotransferase [Pseudomonadota bacterium]